MSKTSSKSYGYDQENPSLYGVPDKKAGWNSYIFFVGFTASLASLAYGYTISAIDSPKIVFNNCHLAAPASNFFTSCVSINDDFWKYVVAAWCFGGLFGALAAGSLTQKFGRKNVLIGHNIPFLVGTAFLSLAPNFALLVIGRILIGFACGICTVVVPMYLSEISPDAIRGQVSIMHQSAIVLGIFIAQVLAFFLSNATLWRIYFIIPGIFCGLQTFFLFGCPESPKFLAEKGNMPEATVSLKRLRKAFDVSEEVSRLEASRQQSTSIGSVESMSILALLSSRVARKSTIVSVAYHGIQQFSGINAVFFFSTTLFAGLGVDEKLVSVLIGILNIIMTGVSIALMDKAGRRPLSLVSTLVMGIGAIGIVLSLVMFWNILCILFIFLFVGGFAVGLGPVPWVILGDIFPSSAVDAGVTLAIGVNWTAQVFLSFFLLDLKKLVDKYIFMIFAVFLFSFLAFNYVYIPETKGKPAQFL